MTIIAAPIRFARHTLVLAALLCALPSGRAQAQDQPFSEMVRKFVLAPPGAPESAMLAKTVTAVQFLQRMELPQASRALNEALQLDPGNSQLHFLNGFIYHLQARQGDAQKSPMAIEGYQQALRLEPGNWIAQEFLGLAYLDQRNFDEARQEFAQVLLMAPDSAVSIYGLMASAYLTGDAVTACAMADQYQKVVPKASDAFLRSSVSVYAACGSFAKAERMRDALRAAGGRGGARADQRLAQWRALYRQQDPDGAGVPGLTPASLKSLPAPLQLAQAFTVPSIKPPPPVVAEPAPHPAAAAAPARDMGADGPRMVLVDVVLISTQDLISTSKGVNLLSALTLQLGSVAGNLAAYSRIRTSNSINDAAASLSTAITRAVTVPALSYSLNIANANDSVNEVLARPTLAAVEGMPSEFFSGTNLSAGVVSLSAQGGTTVVPVEKRFGIKLSVLPTFLSNGRVQLKVDAVRTALNANTDNPRVAYQLEIGEISANANVVMNLGDTLVLSGLTEKSNSRTRDGVPLLQDLPVVQYLFSNKKTNDVQRSVLILITPRSPAYTGAADAGQNGQASASMRALREKFGFSATGASNVEAVLGHLQANTLFREFREGDVSLERWEHMDSTGERLRQSLDFLYY